ncbi:MAG: GH3 auxin-responsive promoter [Chloroflexi bacterium]|nr:MAG: GH3 auxin-responsive promoter [Chloroflexota bacterium]
MATAIELIRQGRKTQVWTKYCGFLDLSIDEFMQIQERLLLEQISLLHTSEIGKEVIGSHLPTSLEEFRNTVSLTTYEDYEKYFEEQIDDVLPEKAYAWGHTSGRSGKFKWVPYTKQAYDKMGERVLAGIILAAAREKGDMRLQEDDTMVYNTPPRPYISGIVLRALADQFNFNFIPPLDKTEEMEFQERIASGFDYGMRNGIDILGSLSVVLVRMGERFAEGASSGGFSARMLYPPTLFRLIRGYLRARLEGRPMLPKDLWKIKALPTGGMDTSLYRDKITYYWGVEPHEQYGSTEEGAIATQAWNKKGMIFFPDAALLEFIPEEEWVKTRQDPNYIPQTVLLNEVEANKKYEVVITNFNGRPLVRYRMHDIIEFTDLEDKEAGIALPQMQFVGRSADFIDLAGFTGLIDEKMVWRSMLETEIDYEEWSIRKESEDSDPILHLYFEPKEMMDGDTVKKLFHERLAAHNPFYADYADMIGKDAIKVTMLHPGAFMGYMQEMNERGADLAHIKPPHMNASDEIIAMLLDHSKKAAP